MVKKHNLPKLGFLYLDYVLRFFDYSNFKGWPDKIEAVTYHWKNDRERFIKEVKRKKIDVLVGNIPATAYETFKEIAKELPNVRFIPSIETQFSNKSKENVTLFCQKYDIQTPKTIITYSEDKADSYFKSCHYPQIIKRSYGPSNYGGYYVHKVDNYQEAKELLGKKNYKPVYSQDAIPLKDSGDIRVMLIGHKPICAFWRYSGIGEWITNTSQGGSMSYENIPMSALELAVKASKAAKAEYWACDIAIDENTNEAYMLECATAFAAFPYVRDWIGQYIMWDLSAGKFRLPHVPLFSWEELGKMNPSVLRTIRQLYFAQYEPSVDGTYWLEDKGNFDMELTDESNLDDIPASIKPPINEDKLPQMLKTYENEVASEINEKSLYSLVNVSLTELMTLEGMEEDVAVKIKELAQDGIISTLKDLSEYHFTYKEQVSHWAKSFNN
ncbi:RimK family alpha-L-glutamate ligase [Sulfurimonas sp.]|uniref:ATP-grasp domain-containing protein n=1 Tax=Sulfurimonas sp. TaxID=2022749 RepID=UPI0035688A01